MKEILLPVPDGKTVMWEQINGKTVAVLVDEPKEDRPVTERIKTFEDACNSLGDEHPLVVQFNTYNVAFKGEPQSEDMLAYFKLRIIVAALNEGWEPQFTEDEYRYFPWFYLYTQKEYDNMNDEQKGRCVLRSGFHTNASCGIVYVYAFYDSSLSTTYHGSRLAFRTRELAIYAGKQFLEEWADFMFKPRNNEGLNEKSEATNSETTDSSTDE